MIYSINGILEMVEPYHIVVECGGIGYSIKTSMTTISKLPQSGEKIHLFTHLVIKEDALELYGFSEMADLQRCKMMISVSGVGPKAAVSILSNLSPERFALCVASGDAKSLRAPGVGPKTSERIVLELKDKVSKAQIASGIASTDSPAVYEKGGNAAEAISALEVLGYTRGEAAGAVGKLDASMSVEEMIKSALKMLAGKV